MLDKWNARLLANSKYDGKYEIPIIKKCNLNPSKINRIIPFSEILRTKDYDQIVCFYENDECFEKIWNRPTLYIDRLKMFNGVISPDFSVYQDMPLAQQIYNIYRQRVIGSWLQSNGINVITNVRWGDYRTYKISTYGVPKNSVIAIGTIGCFKNKKETIDSFYEGLIYIIKKLNPNSIIIYGPKTKKLSDILYSFNITTYYFPSFRWINREVNNG